MGNSSLSRELIKELLKITRHKSTFSEKELLSNIAGELVSSAIDYLLRRGALTVEVGGRFRVSDDQRVRLAMEAARVGCDVKEVCKLLSWQEFEAVIEYALNVNGYKTLKRVILRQGGKRWEIDLLGGLGALVVAIDCKHWKRVVSKRVIEAQIMRAKILASSRELRVIAARLELSKSGVSIIPLIVTLSEAPFQFYEGVPVVPVFKLGSFLSELPAHLVLSIPANGLSRE